MGIADDLERILPWPAYAAVRSAARRAKLASLSARAHVSPAARAARVGSTPGDLRAALARSFNTPGQPMHAYATLQSIRVALEAGCPGHALGEVLEIGSYERPHLALGLLLCGATRVHVDNIRPIENELDADYAATLAAFVTLTGRAAAPLDRLVEPAGRGGRLRIRAPLLVVHAAKDAAALGLADGSIDTVVSMSVLEHIRHLDEVLASVARATRPGGAAVHSIDFRDHSAFDDPHRFRRLDEAAFARRYDESHNRGLLPDYLAALDRAGHEVTWVARRGRSPLTSAGGTDVLGAIGARPELCGATDPDALETWVTEADRAALAPEFRRHDLATLSVLSAVVVARRRGG